MRWSILDHCSSAEQWGGGGLSGIRLQDGALLFTVEVFDLQTRSLLATFLQRLHLFVGIHLHLIIMENIMVLHLTDINGSSLFIVQVSFLRRYLTSGQDGLKDLVNSKSNMAVVYWKLPMAVLPLRKRLYQNLKNV